MYPQENRKIIAYTLKTSWLYIFDTRKINKKIKTFWSVDFNYLCVEAKFLENDRAIARATFRMQYILCAICCKMEHSDNAGGILLKNAIAISCERFLKRNLRKNYISTPRWRCLRRNKALRLKSVRKGVMNPFAFATPFAENRCTMSMTFYS